MNIFVLVNDVEEEKEELSQQQQPTSGSATVLSSLILVHVPLPSSTQRG